MQKFCKEQLAGSMIELRNTGHLMILTIILSRPLLAGTDSNNVDIWHNSIIFLSLRHKQITRAFNGENIFNFVESLLKNDDE